MKTEREEMRDHSPWALNMEENSHVVKALIKVSENNKSMKTEREEKPDSGITYDEITSKYNDSSKYFYKHNKDGSGVIVDKKTWKVVKKYEK